MTGIRGYRSAALAGAAGCAIALAGGCGTQHAGAYAPAGPTSPPARPAAVQGHDVPWSARTAPPYKPAPAATPTAPAAEFPACTAAGLTAHPQEGNPAAGSYLFPVVLTNTGDKPCTLTGGPSYLAGIRADGSRKVLVSGTFGDESGMGLIGPANLRPGQKAEVLISFSDPDCSAGMNGQHDYYTAVAIGIGSSGEEQARLTGGLPPLDAVCGAGVSNFGVLSGVSDVVPSPLDVLTVSRSMPASVTAGSEVTYRVTLTNPASHRVPLSPCPSYEEFMATDGTGIPSDVRYYLNCAAAPVIPARGAVTFDIQITAPATAGTAKFVWLIQGTTLATGGVITIRGR